MTVEDSPVVSAESTSAAVAVVIFISVFVVVQLVISALRGSSVERAFVHQLASRPTAHLLSVLSVQDPPRAMGNQLVGQARKLTIEAGCDGTETLALLIAALAALRLPLKRSLIVLGYGTAIVLVLNHLRLSALWWAMGTDARLFDMVHSQIAPALLVSAVGLIIFLTTRIRPRCDQAA